MDGDEAETLIWADLAAGDSGEWEVEIASGKVFFSAPLRKLFGLAKAQRPRAAQGMDDRPRGP
jgi:hypothetical protein